jgi:protein PhnA
MTYKNDWDDVVWDDELGEFVPAKGKDEGKEEIVRTKDSNGKVLETGDSVTLIKDLDVKGSTLNLKRGTKIKNIKLIGDPENIECKVGKSVLVLKTCFLKK